MPGAPNVPSAATPSASGDLSPDEQKCVLDAKTLEGLRMLAEATGTDLLADLAKTFREDTPKRIAALREALRAGDADGVKRVAHSLRGSAGALGATHLFAVASELERAAEHGAPVGWERMVDAIERSAARAVDALEHEIRSSPPAQM
jgi:HPt (histidine-containing phosphotransfer) domain-containing protein